MNGKLEKLARFDLNAFYEFLKNRRDVEGVGFQTLKSFGEGGTIIFGLKNYKGFKVQVSPRRIINFTVPSGTPEDKFFEFLATLGTVLVESIKACIKPLKSISKEEALNFFIHEDLNTPPDIYKGLRGFKVRDFTGKSIIESATMQGIKVCLENEINFLDKINSFLENGETEKLKQFIKNRKRKVELVCSLAETFQHRLKEFPYPPPKGQWVKRLLEILGQ